MRFYDYKPHEVVAAADDATGMLPLDIDPKLAWALKFRDRFPVDVNRAPREDLLRVPGLGVKAVDAIVRSRRWRRLRLDDVARLTASVAKVRPFLMEGAASLDRSLFSNFEHGFFAKLVPNVRKLGLLDANDGYLRTAWEQHGLMRFEFAADTASDYESYDAVAADRAAAS